MKRVVLLLTVASFACNTDPTGPVGGSDIASDPPPAVAPMNGAMVIRLTEGQFLLPTADPETGLVSVHYASAAFFTAFTGCAVPPFEGVIDLQIVNVPTGKQKRLFSGDSYVRVYALAGFPGNVFACGPPVAEGPVDIHGGDHLEAPGAFATVVGSFASNGVITNNADGSDVRLHHTTKLDGSGGFPPSGTVRLH